MTGVTLASCRSLFKKLKKKYPTEDISVDITFSTWHHEHEHVSVYVSKCDISTVLKFHSIEEVLKAYDL